MTTSTPNGRPLSSKKRGGTDASDTRKRTRISTSRYESVFNEPLFLRGGGSFTPAAGTWQGRTSAEPGQGRLFDNLERVPLSAALGIPSPAPPMTQTGLGGLTRLPKPVRPDGRDANMGRQTPRNFRTPVRPSNRTGHLPSPRTTPRSRLDGDEAATLGSDGNWGPQDPRWNTDKQIIKGWGTLEGLIEKYVSDVIVDSIPDIDTTHLVFPYEALHRLSDLAGPIVRHERYAKYIFQLSIWNILSVKFLSHMATEWACEEKGTSQWSQKTKGLAAAMDLLTFQHSMDPRSTMLRRERDTWYNWRKYTVDTVYEWLSRDTDYEQTVETAVFDILTMYQGHLKPAFAGGDRASWDKLVWRTTEIVVFAAQLSIMMRRSQDGTWSPFIPLRLVAVKPEVMMRHQDTAASLPPRQDGVKAGSKVTMTVVPGLSKYEMTDVDDDPAHPGVQNTSIRKKVRVKAKCLIDITEEQTGERRAGDVWVPDDL